MSNSALSRWLQHLETLHPDAMELGLERVSRVARDLDLLAVDVPVVTVAGTNGKGSTVAVLESLACEVGATPGAFTSPHFFSFNERIRIGREPATDAELVAAFAAIEAARRHTSLTYFEFATLAALWLFRSRGVDLVLLEVGLGGRLDAANIVDADLALITSIDLDHQAWLGETREAIAAEKAGIMRPGRPVLIADPEPPQALFDCAAARGAEPVYALGEAFRVEREPGHWRGSITTAAGRGRTLPRLALGSLQPANICLAAQAAALLRLAFSDRQFAAALDRAYIPGRLQYLEIAGRHCLLDVAHNPAAVDKLLENICATPCKGRVIALFSAMKDKAIGEMLALCAGRFDAWFLGGQPDNPRAASAEAVAGLLRELGEEVIGVSADLDQAFHRARAMLAEGDLLVVFGSFYTVAAVLPQLDEDLGTFGTDE